MFKDLSIQPFIFIIMMIAVIPVKAVVKEPESVGEWDLEWIKRNIGTEDTSLNANTHAIRALAWHPTKKFLAAANEGGAINIWHVRSKESWYRMAISRANSESPPPISQLLWKKNKYDAYCLIFFYNHKGHSAQGESYPCLQGPTNVTDDFVIGTLFEDVCNWLGTTAIWLLGRPELTSAQSVISKSALSKSGRRYVEIRMEVTDKSEQEETTYGEKTLLLHSYRYMDRYYHKQIELPEKYLSGTTGVATTDHGYTYAERLKDSEAVRDYWKKPATRQFQTDYVHGLTGGRNICLFNDNGTIFFQAEHSQSVHSVEFKPSAAVFAAGGAGKKGDNAKIEIWKFGIQKPNLIIETKQNAISLLAWNQKGNRLASVDCQQRTLVVWEYANHYGQAIARHTFDVEPSVIRWAEDRNALAVGMEDGSIALVKEKDVDMNDTYVVMSHQ